MGSLFLCSNSSRCYWIYHVAGTMDVQYKAQVTAWNVLCVCSQNSTESITVPLTEFTSTPEAVTLVPRMEFTDGNGNSAHGGTIPTANCDLCVDDSLPANTVTQSAVMAQMGPLWETRPVICRQCLAGRFLNCPLQSFPSCFQGQSREPRDPCLCSRAVGACLEACPWR